MKKIYFLLFSFITLSSLAFGQTYTIDPVSKTVTGTVDTSAYMDLDIDLHNTGSVPITFEYRAISNTLPSGWGITLCDYQTCYSFIPTGLETMDPLPIATKAFLKLTIAPGTITGMGSVSFMVYDQNNSSVVDTLIFNVTAAIGAVKDISDAIEVYPNPSTGTIFLSAVSGNLAQGTARIFDLTGALVTDVKVDNGFRTELSLEGKAEGLYILRYETANGFATRKIQLSY